MDQNPPGWYEDPASKHQQRWWDGEAWTTETAMGSRAPASPPASVLAARAAAVPPVVDPVSGEPVPVVAVPPAGPRPGDPAALGGDRLAGWWQRVAANLLDAVILGVVLFVLNLYFLRKIAGLLSDYLDEFDAAQRAGRPTPPVEQFYDQVIGEALAVLAISMLLSLLYYVGFLLWSQATPGKRLVGLRVRRVTAPGPLPPTPVVVRWLAQTAPSVFYLVPVVGLIAALYVLVDVLWPLWDPRKQTLHDKIARTVVVRAI